MSYSQTIKTKEGFESIKDFGETVKLTSIDYKKENPLFNSIIYLTKENKKYSAYELSQNSKDAVLKKSKKTGEVYLFIGNSNYLLDNPNGVNVLTCQGVEIQKNDFEKIYKSASPVYKNESREEILSFLKERIKKPQLNILNPLNANRELPREKIKPKGFGIK